MSQPRLVEVRRKVLKQNDVLAGELRVVLGRVERRGEQLGAGFGELGGSVTEPLPLLRSAGGERLGEPPEHHPSPRQLAERNGVAVLIRQGERWCDDPLGEHGEPPGRRPQCTRGSAPADLVRPGVSRDQTQVQHDRRGDRDRRHQHHPDESLHPDPSLSADETPGWYWRP